MVQDFDYFVILAEMRTGSNYLEENLNQYSGLHCHGELFNPHFLGGPEKAEKFGISIEHRNKNPQRLIEKIQSFDDGLHGFRYFHDHDPRILQSCLTDSKCAKIILTRNPVESYVSREIARQTKQWRLGDLNNAKSAKVFFDQDEFTAHLDRHQKFQRRILKLLQTSGQTGFYLAYEDISDIEVLNGLALFLGVNESRKKPTAVTKKQNPQSLQEKVTNFEEMQAALASVDYFSLSELPNFEPRRGASLPSYVASPKTPLLFAPIPAGPTATVIRWMMDLDSLSESQLETGFSQKSLRHWKRSTGFHRTFTVLRHPVLRLHDTFVRNILKPGDDKFTALRQTLINSHGVSVPLTLPDKSYDANSHRLAFIAFAAFVKGNLNGQTGIRVVPAWASQSEILRGFGQFVFPDFVFREEDLPVDLANLARSFDLSSPKLTIPPGQTPFELHDIYDDEVEAVVKSAYQRDYMMFGFGPWFGKTG